MESGPQVSVVLPVHDTPLDFFREAIDSVRAQRDVRWELVIVLDAATEGCARAARAMAALDPDRIQVVGHVGGTPRRPSGARNLGIARTRAPVIGFLDSDDVFEPHALATRLAALAANPGAAMVFGSTLYWHSWTAKATDRDYVPSLGVEPETVYAPPSLVPRFLDGTAVVPCPCSILVTRAAVEAVGGFDESVRNIYEDQAFLARIALRFPLLADGRVLDRYRQHSDSWTATAGLSSEREARMYFLDWLEKEIAAAGVSDPTLRRAVTRERWKLRHPHLARLIRLVRRVPRRLAATARPGTSGQRHAESSGANHTRSAS
ncbi:MAG TPA: glycosyltransferase family 2 protein [Gemmatimonadaceae bacterium]|nr:glycosyltransferase family 2 protein [Gemmatimonadaceae bacterium]